MATITKRGRGWQAKIRRAGHPTFSNTFDTRAEAERWAESIERDLGHGIAPAMAYADRLTLGDALERYAAEVTAKKKGKAQERYRVKAWLAHPFAKRPLSSLRGADFAAYRDARLASGAAPATVRLELAVVSNLFTRCAKEWGLEGLANPLASTVLPRPGRGRERRLRPGEEARLLEAASQVDSRLPAVIVWALETAMRRGEIAALTPDCIDHAAKVATLRDTKNGAARTVPLSSRALAVAPLPRISAARISRAFTEACRLAGIPDLRFHDLRHEATSRLFELGRFNVVEISMITGHRDLHMLRRYTHLSARQLAERLG